MAFQRRCGSLESDVPFVDMNVVEFAETLPADRRDKMAFPVPSGEYIKQEELCQHGFHDHDSNWRFNATTADDSTLSPKT